MGVEPSEDPVYQRILEIGRRLVTDDSRLSEAEHDGTDVLVFEFD